MGQFLSVPLPQLEPIPRLVLLVRESKHKPSSWKILRTVKGNLTLNRQQTKISLFPNHLCARMFMDYSSQIVGAITKLTLH